MLTLRDKAFAKLQLGSNKRLSCENIRRQHSIIGGSLHNGFHHYRTLGNGHRTRGVLSSWPVHVWVGLWCPEVELKGLMGPGLFVVFNTRRKAWPCQCLRYQVKLKRPTTSCIYTQIFVDHTIACHVALAIKLYLMNKINNWKTFRRCNLLASKFQQKHSEVETQWKKKKEQL